MKLFYQTTAIVVLSASTAFAQSASGAGSDRHYIDLDGVRAAVASTFDRVSDWSVAEASRAWSTSSTEARYDADEDDYYGSYDDNDRWSGRYDHDDDDYDEDDRWDGQYENDGDRDDWSAGYDDDDDAYDGGWRSAETRDDDGDWGGGDSSDDSGGWGESDSSDDSGGWGSDSDSDDGGWGGGDDD